jgi:[protein-PII] uridylyltransferase
VDVPDLRTCRRELLDGDLKGMEFARAYAAKADEWLRALTEEAELPRDGVALIAVGGYGRGELCPGSDLDLLLVHRSVRKISGIADKIWYPIWDQGVGLDHSVRTPREVEDLAREDLRVALGLLDGRLIAGDPSLAREVVDQVTSSWAGELGDAWLPELERQMAVRHDQHGDSADLLEPDLKEAHGGLRDINVLSAVRLAFPDIESIIDISQLWRSRDELLEARVALHAITGRSADELLLQDQDAVAARVGGGDADDLMRRLSAASRFVARSSDLIWRRRRYLAPAGLAGPRSPAVARRRHRALRRRNSPQCFCASQRRRHVELAHRGRRRRTQFAH